MVEIVKQIICKAAVGATLTVLCVIHFDKLPVAFRLLNIQAKNVLGITDSVQTAKEAGRFIFIVPAL